jgi:hypothetical protein
MINETPHQVNTKGTPVGIKRIIRSIAGTVRRAIGPLEPVVDEVVAGLKKAKLADGRSLGAAIADEIRKFEADKTRSGNEKLEDIVNRYWSVVLDLAIDQIGLPDAYESAAKHITRQLVQSIFVGVRGQTSSPLALLINVLLGRVG